MLILQQRSRFSPSIRFIRYFLLALLITTGIAEAQTGPSYYMCPPSATACNVIPFRPSSSSFYAWQGVFAPNMFPGAYAGNISRIWFKSCSSSSGANTGTTYSNFQVQIGQTSGSISTTQWHSPMTTCLSATSYTITAFPANSWFAIDLTTPFMYNPNQTLIIKICSDGYTGSGFGLDHGNVTSTTWVGRLYGGPGCSAPVSSSTSGYLPCAGFDLNPALPDDAGISKLISPVNFCAGTHDLQVELYNYGTNTLNSVTVNWTWNGVPQTPINWTTAIPSLGTATVTLASGQNFQAGTPYNLVAWTSNPNNTNDSFTANDSLVATMQAALSGTFTIGGASPDYTTFAAAVKDLNTFGLCGPVVFNVRSGTYNEQISINDIPGASAINTVTFQSETGNTPDVNLTWAASSSANNYVVQFSGAKYVTFRNMTMTATGSSYGYVVYFPSTSEYITIENCELMGVNTTSTSYSLAVVYSEYNNDDYTTFRNCGIREGSYGMYLRGSSGTSPEEYTTVENCEFTGQYYYYPYYSYYQAHVNFVDNTIRFTSPSYSYCYAAYFGYGDNNNIERNTFWIDGASYAYGLYVYRQNYYRSGTTRIVNNFISITNTGYVYYALRNYYADNSYIAHNTIYTNSRIYPSTAYYYSLMASYYSLNAEYYNNIFYNAGGSMSAFATYSSSTYDPIASDYNVFYSNGSFLAYWNGNRADLAALQTASGMDQHSISKTVFFENPNAGDLHLSGPSEDDTDLFGTLLKEVTIDIDHEARVNPYRGADEACYVLPGSLTYEFVDGQGMPAGYAEAPGTIGLKYGVTFPEFASTVTFTVSFFNPVTNALVYQTSFSAAKQYGVPLSGTHYINLPATVPPGAYKIEVNFNTKNSCDVYSDYMPYPSALLVVPEGRIPCVVWPGDANNDGVVNYTDRRALNMYIYNANLRTSWLNGPPRYQADVEINPFTYLEWKPQAAAPWQTPEGCYMDTDGNGVVNNLDYIAMKLNWSKMTPWYGGAPKADASVVTGFMMDHNYPNPFNPVTVIRYSVPEPSTVSLVITDALGRIVVEERNQGVEKGMHEYTFDGSGLSSGVYVATMTMTGIATGGTYTKTIKMALTR